MEPLNTLPKDHTGVDEKAGTGSMPELKRPSADTDATQVVRIADQPKQPHTPARTSQPARRPSVQTPSASPRKSGVSQEQHYTDRKKSVSKKKRRNRTIIIVVSILAVLMLLGSLAAAYFLMQPEEDDGLILPNVFAAGVNLSGMTQEEAKTALKNATADTYSQLDMSVTVLDTTVTLKPAATGAKLNIDKVVEEAYNYGRTGSKAEQQRIRTQAASSVHVISVIPYLNLDTNYIQSVVNDFGSKYSSTLAQPSYRIEGTAPTFGEADTDTSVVYETLYIFTGTPEYGLNTNALYEQILEAYNTNIWQVTGKCTVTTPEALDLQPIYDQYCKAPKDAELDELTYEVTPEVYGYGFDLTAAREQLLNAEYNTTIEIPMQLIAPDILAEDYEKLFRDTLAKFTTSHGSNTDLMTNLKKAIAEINGTIIKVGEEFSFNETVGQPTVGKGYKYVEMYVGTEYKEVLGGGMSQVSSMLYYCALLADLDILERSNHTYVQDFSVAGADAYTAWNEADLRFVNSTNEPIRIDAKMADGQITISFIGTDDRDYRVELVFEEEKVYKPTNLKHLMFAENKDGYKDGDVLVEPITGYDISTYICKFDKESGNQTAKELVARSHYEKRNAVIVEIYVAPEPEPTEPSEPSEPSESTNPSDSTEPDETTPSTEATEGKKN